MEKKKAGEGDRPALGRGRHGRGLAGENFPQKGLFEQRPEASERGQCVEVQARGTKFRVLHRTKSSRELMRTGTLCQD